MIIKYCTNNIITNYNIINCKLLNSYNSLCYIYLHNFAIIHYVVYNKAVVIINNY